MSKATEELRSLAEDIGEQQMLQRLPNLVNAVLAELEQWRDKYNSIFTEYEDLRKELERAQIRLAWFDSHNPINEPDVQEGVIQKLGLVDGEALKGCRKELDQAHKGWAELREIAHETAMERDRLRKELEQAQAACAQMRQCIEAFMRAINDEKVFFALGGNPTPELKVAGELTKQALATDCGKGWHSPQEYEKLETACAQMRLTLEHCQHDHPLDSKGGIMIPRKWTCPRCLVEQTDSGAAFLDRLKNAESERDRYREALEELLAAENCSNHSLENDFLKAEEALRPKP